MRCQDETSLLHGMVLRKNIERYLVNVVKREEVKCKEVNNSFHRYIEEKFLIMAKRQLDENDLEAIKYLREKAHKKLTQRYDTDFNLLRWAQGYDYNLKEAAHHLDRHLKIRKFFDLDNADKIPDNKMLVQCFPLELVGDTGKGNYLLVVECAGQIDLHGILKTIQLNTFLLQRLKFQETVLRKMNELEEKTGSQCAAIYILDLEDLKLDPTLLSTATGPYHKLWNLVYTNYPEWIDTMLIVNAPTFIYMIWKAVASLLPERTRNKVQIFTTGSDIVQVLSKFCDMEFVPERWGGGLNVSREDLFLRDRRFSTAKFISKSLYWEPDEMSPAVHDLQTITLDAGGCRIICVKVFLRSQKMYLALNRYAERSYSMAIYHTSDIDAVNIGLEEMDEWIPKVFYPEMPTVDLVKTVSLGPGVYKFRFGNEQAWLRSVKFYYRIRFLDESGNEIYCQQTCI